MKTSNLKQIRFVFVFALLACAARAQTGWTNTYGPAQVAIGGYMGVSTVLPLVTAVDRSGNVFFAGTGVDTNNLIFYVSIKYSNAGVPIWTNLYTGPVIEGPAISYASASAIAVDGNGNAFVTGFAFDETNFYYATLKYSNAGVPLWTNLYTGPVDEGLLVPQGSAYASAIAVDGNGNAFVTGYSYDVSNNEVYATVKYSNAGVPLWTNLFYAGTAYAIAVDGNGNVFVTGSPATIKYSNAGVPLWTNLYAGAAYAIAVDTNGNVLVTGSWGSDYATIKYSNAGVPLWTNFYYYGNSGYNPAIAVDGSGNAFVTGTSFDGANFYYATLKYSNVGVPLWTNLYAGPLFEEFGYSDSSASAIAMDGNGNAFVTGRTYDLTNAYNATLKYSNAGVPLWANLYTATGNSFSSAIAVDGSGNAFVTDAAEDATNFYYFTIEYPAASAPPVAYLQGQWLNQQLVLSWTNAGFSLQSAPQVTGTFTNIPGATSPYTNPVTGAQQFFRLMQ